MVLLLGVGVGGVGVGVGLKCMISDYLINLAVAIQAARLIQRQNKFNIKPSQGVLLVEIFACQMRVTVMIRVFVFVFM